MLTPRLIFKLLFLATAVQGTVAANWQDATQEPGSIFWRPTTSDRQACKLGESVTVNPIARVSYKKGTSSYKLLVFKAEFPERRLVFAASIFNLDHPRAARSELECLWNLDYSRYLRSYELALGPAMRAVRIDVENLTGEVQVALIVGEVDGKVQRLLSFRPSEACPPDLAPCWNYLRTMTVLPADKNAPFYDVRIDTKSWCTEKGDSKCMPETGPQRLTYSEVFTFESKEYHKR